MTVRLPAALLAAALCAAGPAAADDFWSGSKKAAAPAGPATIADLEAAEQAVLDIQERLAFQVRNVTLVTRKSEGFRDVARRRDAVFAQGEPILVYAEPMGYGVRGAEGDFSFGMKVDYVVRSKAGTVMARQDGFQAWSLRPPRRRVPFHCDLSLDIQGLEQGAYVLTYTLHDAVSGKMTTFDVPFTVSGRGA